jgi:hypothetical protein
MLTSPGNAPASPSPLCRHVIETETTARSSKIGPVKDDAVQIDPAASSRNDSVRRRLVRQAVVLAGALGATLLVASPPVGAASTPWAYPRVHMWASAHSQDLGSVLAAGGTVATGMRKCPDGSTGGGCSTLSPDPADWSSQLAVTDCPSLTAATSAVRVDGAIPNREVQRWWNAGLQDEVRGCSAIVAATTAYQRSASAGSAASGVIVKEAGHTAATDLLKARTLIDRVGNAVNAVRH